MIKRIFNIHAALITILVLLFIALLDLIRINLHFLDPFNYGMKDYEITDIVFSQLQSGEITPDTNIVLINTGKPDREKLFGMLERLSQFEPAVVGIDILFEEKKDPEIDSRLARAMQKIPNLVLASRLYDYNDSHGHFERNGGCNPYFARHSKLGFINFVTNESRTIRIFSPKEQLPNESLPSFGPRIAELFDSVAVRHLWERNKSIERINFLGNTDWFLQMEGQDILDTTLDLSFMKGKIILMGFLGEYDWSDPLIDRFFTPLNEKYTGHTVPDMYGIVIHANIISMILQKRYISEIPKWLIRLLEVLFCYVNVLIIQGVYIKWDDIFHGATRLLQMVEFVFIFFLIATLFYYFRVKMDFAIGILAMILVYDFVMIYETFFRPRVDKWFGRVKPADAE